MSPKLTASLEGAPASAFLFLQKCLRLGLRAQSNRAVWSKILDDTHAEISVPRKSACGHDCEECAGCGVSGVSVYAKALNTVGAQPGQKVVVESDTKKMLKIVSFVYLIPVVLFLAGYLITLALTPSVAVQYTVAVAGAVLGVLLAVWYDRRVKARGGLSFTIVRVF